MSLRLSETLRRAWTTNPVLVVMIVFSSVCFLISATGLTFTTRLINGEHAWIKPLKFSISLTMYGLTLFWFARFLKSHEIFFRRVCVTALVGTVAELFLIIMQVARGTTSHFNTATPFDHTVFWLTAIAILPVAFGAVALFVMLLREKDLPPVLGVALRLGVILTVVGFIPGILMLLPDVAQDLITHSKQFDGHTVGFSEGGPGLPYIGWSTVAGDLRVAHFVGIHALQILPLAGYAVMKGLGRFSLIRQEMFVWNIGLTYLSWIILLTKQALSAEPVIAPSPHTIVYAILVVAFSLTSAVLILFARRPKTRLFLDS